MCAKVASPKLSDLLQRFVAEGCYAGVSVLARRRGQELHRVAAGLQDIESQRPMTTDSIVRIYSITKILTSVAALTFVEQGTIALADPVDAYLPEARGWRVYAGGSPEDPELRDPMRPLMLWDLFRHTAGLPYLVPGTPHAHLLEQARLTEAVSLADKVRRIARVPLARDPGVQFEYGYATDLLARVLEVVSGQPFEAVLTERVLEPAGMSQTGFSVADQALDRLAMVHEGRGPGLPLKMVAIAPGEARPGAWGYPEGGSGLYSTLNDLARFGEILCAGGELNGVRLLGRKTLQWMTADHLLGTASPWHSFEPGCGFGLGVSVRVESGMADRADSIGTFGWSGLASTSLRVDPLEQLVLVLFAQHFPYDEHRLFGRVTNMVYAQL
ncbi:MAG TPA: serine hydrolase domain-containing protein [Chthoniobacterales bacterium]